MNHTLILGISIGMAAGVVLTAVVWLMRIRYLYAEGHFAFNIVPPRYKRLPWDEFKKLDRRPTKEEYYRVVCENEEVSQQLEEATSKYQTLIDKLGFIYDEANPGRVVRIRPEELESE